MSFQISNTFSDWDKLIFSLRSKKGIPNNYPDVTSKKLIPLKSSIAKWTKHIDGAYRGALHIRTKKIIGNQIVLPTSIN